MDITNETRTESKKGSRFSSQPVGWLLGWFGLLGIVAILIIAAWNGQSIIVAFLGILLAAAGLSRLWSRFSLTRVSCQRLISRRRLFPGEETELRMRIANGKLLPLPWVQVDDQIPLGFAPDIIRAEECRPGAGFLSRATALLWYTAASWRCSLKCPKRGYYQVGPLTMTSGDIFGFYPRSVIEPSIEHLIVYPRIFPISRLGIPSVYPLGETGAERRIFEDPTRTTGIRDYSPQDSLRRIHWKASARHQKLKSRVYEPTTTLKVALFLAIDSFPQDGARSRDDFEFGISLAASLANHLIDKDNPVGLFLNTRLADSGQTVSIRPGSSIDNLVSILEALAKTTHNAAVPFLEFMDSQRGALPWGATLVFIISRTPQYLGGLLVSLREAGYKLLVIQVGEDSGARPAGIAWQNISGHADLAPLTVGENL